MNKTAMSVKERSARSRLTKLASQLELVRGNLVFRERVCGKDNCRCMRGQRHRSMYLTCSINGQIKQVYIPEAWQQRVSEWVAQYKDARELLEEISTLYLERLSKRKE